MRSSATGSCDGILVGAGGSLGIIVGRGGQRFSVQIQKLQHSRLVLRPFHCNVVVKG